MLDEYDIKKLIAKSLYQKDIINHELYVKCSKPHITSLPYDLRTNDPMKLEERKKAINEKIDEYTNNLNELHEEYTKLNADLDKEEIASKWYLEAYGGTLDNIHKGIDEFRVLVDDIRTELYKHPQTGETLKKDEMQELYDGLGFGRYLNNVEHYCDVVTDDLNFIQTKFDEYSRTGEPLKSTKFLKTFNTNINILAGTIRKMHTRQRQLDYDVISEDMMKLVNQYFSEFDSIYNANLRWKDNYQRSNKEIRRINRRMNKVNKERDKINKILSDLNNELDRIP